MKHFFGRILCLLLCIVFALNLVTTVYAADGDEIRAIKKVISVVCDDSGSMSGEKWTYANYATQALIAQLNEQDELYITFMSSPDKAVKVNMADLPGEVKNMGKRDCPGGTPYQAVATAYHQIELSQTQDTNVQYWLMVTTDGSIAGIPNGNGMNGTLQSVLDKYKSSKMKNGTRLNVAYLAMDAQYECFSDTSNNLHTFKATSPQEISTSLSDISNLISSRLKATQVKQVNKKTISFESKLPIYSFSILSHQSSAKVTSASTTENSLNIDRNIKLQKEELFGNVAVVTAPKLNGKNQVVSAGVYTVTFSENVDINNLLIQYEPAIGVKMIVSVGGVEVNDFSTLKQGTKISVELIPIIPGTNTIIDPATLPKGIQWGIEYRVNDKEKNRANSKQLVDTTICSGENVIRGTMQIPGFSEVVFEKRFELTEVIYGLTVNQPDDASYPRKDPHESITPNNAITITVTNDGVPMTKSELLSLKVELQTDSIEVSGKEHLHSLLRGWTKADVEYRMNDDGTFTLIPKSSVWKAFMVLAGEYTVTLSINNAPNEKTVATFKLVPSFADYVGIVLWVVGFLLLIYLLMLIIKKKFSVQTVEITQYTENSDGTGYMVSLPLVELTPFARGNLFAPTWKPCRVKVRSCNIVLMAGGDGTVIASGDSIQNNKSIKAFGTSTVNPERRLRNIKRSLTKTEVNMGDGLVERSANDIDLNTDEPLYLLMESGIIYCVKLLG